MSQMSLVTIALIVGGVVTLGAYVGFILIPAWSSYDRLWERLAASFLTLFILVALLAIGLAIGVGIVLSYDRFV